MPTIPKQQTLSANTPDILNAIRASASSTYQERVPQATRDNIAKVGEAIMYYESTQNEFLSALVNRIGRVIITSKMYNNPLRMFKKGMMSFGETVEEVFVNIARAQQFDPAVAEKEVFKREIPDVEAIFHKMNYQNFYKATIANDQLRQAFLSLDGITDLIARIVDSMYTGANYDEFLIMKQQFAIAARKGQMYPVTIPAATADNAKQIVTTMKAISNQLEFMSSKFNGMGVLTHTAKEDQIFLIDAAFDAVIDVEVLASAFNMDKVQFLGQRVLVDGFGDLTGVVAAIVDRNWFMVFDNLVNFTENYNGQGLYWNYFYHVWKTFSYSTFSNAILFTTEPFTVTGITVSPDTTTVPMGGTAQFTATVAGTGLKPSGVYWSISDNATNSNIDYKGLLTVGKDETATTITVTATSIYDGTIAGTATVSVTYFYS